MTTFIGQFFAFLLYFLKSEKVNSDKITNKKFKGQIMTEQNKLFKATDTFTH